MIKFTRLLPLAFGLWCLPLTSCATIISGTSQAVSIDSNVEGATVAIEGNVVGATPFTGKIRRQKEAIALVSKDGYEAQPVTLTTSFNPVAVLSILWDWSTTDCLTGAVWEYAPNSYYVNLKPKGTSDDSFRRESSAKAFAMTFFGDLQIELCAGDGPKVRAMRGEFFPDRDLNQFVKDLQAALGDNAVEFGESVADLLSS